MEDSIGMALFVAQIKSRFLDSDIGTIVEVGSLDGQDSIYFKQCFPNARVVAIEGLEENFDDYLDNVTTHGVEWLHRPRRAARFGLDK